MFKALSMINYYIQLEIDNINPIYTSTLLAVFPLLAVFESVIWCQNNRVNESMKLYQGTSKIIASSEGFLQTEF